MPTKPAPKPADDFLYRDCTPEVKALAKQSRRELRQAERARYAQANGLNRTPLR